MRIGTRHVLVSMLPIIVMGIAGAIVTTVTWRFQQEGIANVVKYDATLAASRLDSLISNTSRAADELSHRHTSLDDAVKTIQENTIGDIFASYVSSTNLKIMMTDMNNVALFRNWDPLTYNDTVPADQQGLFSARLIQINGDLHFAISDQAQTLTQTKIGRVLVAFPLDDKLMKSLIIGHDDSLKIGVGDDTLKTLGNFNTRMIRERITIRALPSLWLEINRNVDVLHEQNLQNVTVLAILLLTISVAIGLYVWKTTNFHIIEPIEKIYASIIHNAEVSTLGELPENELGVLARALIKQKMDLARQSALVGTITEQLQKEASLIKVMSHDIATPLTVIKASAGILKKVVPADDQTSANSIRRILSQVTTVEQILGHVRDMKALESGKRSLELKEVQFGPIMEEISDAFRDRLEAKSISLIWNQADAKTTFVADQISFRVSVLSNLISNGIKFSPRGARIEVNCREINGQSRIDVRDFGPGMPASIRDHLFSTTHATNRAGSEGESGTGFGMPLVKFYVDLYGGTIHFVTKTAGESATDHGTTFTILLASKLKATTADTHSASDTTKGAA
jgi:signal transduction histidine kinase